MCYKIAVNFQFFFNTPNFSKPQNVDNLFKFNTIVSNDNFKFDFLLLSSIECNSASVLIFPCS